jgi:hypothetical protein
VLGGSGGDGLGSDDDDSDGDGDGGIVSCLSTACNFQSPSLTLVQFFCF